MNEPKTITLGQLRKELASYPDDAELFFGVGDLAFYRVKNRGPVGGCLLQIEFNELYEVQSED